MLREDVAVRRDVAVQARTNGLNRSLVPRRLSAAAVVVAVLGGLSLWSWRSLVSSGITTHLPPFTTVGDVGQGVFFMGWLPYAIGHGMNPFFSKAMFAPQGVNLLANTSFFLPAFVLSPVTVIFGPIAAFNTAILLGPVISGCALYVVLRKYALSLWPSMLAAVVYAYSPYMGHEVPLGHFNLTWMFFPPPLFYLLDEACRRQQRRPVIDGVMLGLLVALQFFNSPEILLDSAVIAAVLLLLFGLLHPRAAILKIRHAAAAGGVAIAVAGSVLAYPFWFLEFGPEHVTRFNTAVSTLGIAVTSAVWPSAPPPLFGRSPPLLGRIDSGFVGPVLVIIAVCSPLLWRRYRVAPYLLIGASVSYVLALGPYVRISSTGLTRVQSADFWLLSLPPLVNIQPYRFAAFTDLFVAIAVAISLDWCVHRLRSDKFRLRRVKEAMLCTIAVCSVLFFPMLGDNWHYSVQAVHVPRVFTAGPLARVSQPAVAIVAPPGTINRGAPLVWQARAGMNLDETSGYAWRQATRSGVGSTEVAVNSLTSLIGPGYFGQVGRPPAHVTTATIARVRSLLRAWHVDVIVLVDGYGDTGPQDARLFARIIARPPRRVASSYVWTDVWQSVGATRHQ